MQPTDKNNDLLPTRKSDALLGAVLIHAVVAAAFFLKGAILGEGEPVVMSPVGGSGPTAYGFQGGFNSLRTLLIFYVFGLGAPLLIGSVLGAFLGLMIFPALRHRQTAAADPERPAANRNVWRHAPLGAILIHPASIVLTSLWGAVAGFEPYGLSPQGPDPAKAHGFAGAFHGVTGVLYLHLMSNGLTFFVLTGVGALCGTALGALIRFLPRLREAVALELRRTK